MGYQTPEQMRADLQKVVKDPALIEATIKQYNAKLKARAFVPAGNDEEPSKTPEELYEEEMQKASDRFTTAIEAMLAGDKTHTPEKMVWKHRTGEEVSADTKQLWRDYKPKTEADFTPVRDLPCARCGANPEHGCEHTGGAK